MRWQNRQRSSNVSDRRGGGGKIVAGGGLGFIGLALIVALLGGDPTALLYEGVSRTVAASAYDQKISEEDQDKLADFASVVLAETETVWQTKFQENGTTYTEPQMVLFTGATDSACGYAQSAMGPFYCPLDQSIYLDLNFFYDLENRHEAPGDFAQAYVIAHEVGHHVQNLTGVLDRANAGKSRTSQTDANKISVETELMADCFAGIWAHEVDDNGLLEAGDVQEALNAASQIGDDVLQRQSQGRVVPDSFTHGSSEQRFRAFKKGYESGRMAACM